MFPYLVLPYQGQVIPVSDFLRSGSRVAKTLEGKSYQQRPRHRKLWETRTFPCPLSPSPCPTQWWACIFPSLPLAAVTPVDLFMEHSLPAGPAPVSWWVCSFIFAFIILLAFLTLPKEVTMCDYQFAWTQQRIFSPYSSSEWVYLVSSRIIFWKLLDS